ncbi:PadR family transcriptional regulator [Microbacterium paulum]
MEQMRRQWLHGFLDLCLLSLLAERRDYGRGLVERLAAAGFDEVPGGTLYPSLLRLEKQALVRTEWEPSTSGPRRKYYELTAAGRSAVVERTQGWEGFRAAMDAVTAFERASTGGRSS